MCAAGGIVPGPAPRPPPHRGHSLPLPLMAGAAEPGARLTAGQRRVSSLSVALHPALPGVTCTRICPQEALSSSLGTSVRVGTTHFIYDFVVGVGSTSCPLLVAVHGVTRDSWREGGVASASYTSRCHVCGQLRRWSDSRNGTCHLWAWPRAASSLAIPRPPALLQAQAPWGARARPLATPTLPAGRSTVYCSHLTLECIKLA